MTTNARYWWRGVSGRLGASAGAADSLATAISALPAEQTRRLDQQHQGHDDEDHRVRGFGVEDLREPFDHAEREAGDDRAHDGAHPANDHHRENDDDEVGAHQRVDLVD